MKIDVISKYFYPVVAGIETNTLETYKVFVKKGWEVTVHTSKDNYISKDSLPKSTVINGIKVKRYHYSSELTGYVPDINWRKTDIVCLHNFNVSHFRILFKIFLLKISGKKRFALVITPHGGFNPEWSTFSWPLKIMKFIYHYSVGTLLTNITADGLRAVSEWEKAEMIKKGIVANKIRVITNGLENEAFLNVEKLASKKVKNMVKGFGKYIIQIGRVYPIKNYETTIKALARCNQKINYVIVGQTQDEKYLIYLKKLSENLGVGNRVFFTGIIRGIDKYYLIKKAKIMVHMAVYESFCNVVHEGLSQGLICIVANNTALPLLIKNGINGYVVGTRDFVALSKKIDYVLSNFNSIKINKIRTENSKVGLKSSWNFVADQMENFYKKLITKSKKNHKLFNSII